MPNKISVSKRKANLDDDFNFTWLSVSEDIIVLTYGIINDTFENVKLNVIKQVQVEEKEMFEIKRLLNGKLILEVSKHVHFLITAVCSVE